MKTHFSTDVELYDGSQLASLFTYQRFGILGDSITSWIGPCDVTTHMVDAEDQRAGESIRGGLMLHFIIEIFDQPLSLAVSLQRLFASLIQDIKKESLGTAGFAIQRDGDDLYVTPIPDGKFRKWSISIATKTPVSALIHFALNITNQNTPVSTFAIADEVGAENAEVCAVQLARAAMDIFRTEYESILDATKKVHPVGSYQNR